MKSLFAPCNDQELNQLVVKARRITEQRFGRIIQLYAPLYLSNECVDTCSYCGFSRTNQIPRKTLNVESVISETDYLVALGFRHLLYVSGEHPLHVSPSYLESVLKAVRPKLSSVSIEVAPLQLEDYRRLIDVGLDGIVLYQETYDRKAYEHFHLGGPKKSFEGRLEAAETALKSGISSFGMGILLGLSDWRQEAQSLVDHLTKLRKKYWQTEFSISLPRLRPSASDFIPPSPVSDRDFRQLIAALRIMLPDVGIVLSTRESPQLRDQLLGLGITRMSAGSRTEPGGYLAPAQSLKQFEIEDQRSPNELAQVISQKGFDPVWKDWNFLGS